LKVVAIATTSHEVFRAPAFVLHAGKTVVQIHADQIPVNDLLDVGSVESILSFKPILVELNEGFTMLLAAPVVIGRLRIPGTVNGARSGHDFSPLRKSDRDIILKPSASWRCLNL
jgi:hypothetical protein